MLSLDGVSKVYKVGTFGSTRLRAVNGVTFRVGAGEIVALIGESGSGKSTIGRMILGLSRATAGTITFAGQDVAALGKAQLRAYYADVQGVFQDPFSSYNPIFKADRVLSLVKGFFPGVGRHEWEAKVEAALEAVRLEPGACLGKYPHQLSGGQLQRMLVARALLLDIKLLVADEIISMLDASTRIDVLNLLGDLKQRGLGVLFITHDLSLGNYISDRAVILRRGEVVEMGTTTKVFGNPLHPYTRMLLSSVPQLHSRWEAQPAEGAPPPPAGEAGALVAVEPDHLVAVARGTDGEGVG
jgi:ABC-type oligopeptide transport system ATPase subunit